MKILAIYEFISQYLSAFRFLTQAEYISSMRLTLAIPPVLLRGCGNSLMPIIEPDFPLRYSHSAHFQDAQKDCCSHPPNPGAPRRDVLRAMPHSRTWLFVSRISQTTDASPFDVLTALSFVEWRETLHAPQAMRPASRSRFGKAGNAAGGLF